MGLRTAPMDVLLLTDITGIGRKNDLLNVSDGFALNHLLPSRKAIVATPQVRKRYAGEIKARAEARERERELQISVSTALSGKVLHIVARASKNGKLFAAIAAKDISAALEKEHGFQIDQDAIILEEHIKTVGKHALSISVGTQKVPVTVDIAPSEEKI